MDPTVALENPPQMDKETPDMRPPLHVGGKAGSKKKCIPQKRLIISKYIYWLANIVSVTKKDGQVR